MYHELWNLKFSLFWSFRNTMSEGIVLGKWPLQWSAFCSGYQKYRLSLGIIYLTQKTQRMPSRAGSPPKSTIRGTSSFYLPSVSSSVCSFILYGSCANTFQEGKREWWVVFMAMGQFCTLTEVPVTEPEGVVEWHRATCTSRCQLPGLATALSFQRR